MIVGVKDEREDIEGNEARIEREQGKDKPNREKIRGWRSEIKESREKIEPWAQERGRLADANRTLTGVRIPEGNLDEISEGTLGRQNTRFQEATTALEEVKSDKQNFMGVSGIGGDYATQRSDMQRLLDELGTLTTERIKEAVAPIEPTPDEKAEDVKRFFGSIAQLYKDFGPNFRRLPGFQRGGIIPGFGDGDKVHVLAEPGEGFINKRAVQALGGPQAVERINRALPRFESRQIVRQGFQQGGVVQPLQSESDESLLQAIGRLEKALKEQRPQEVHKHIDARHTFANVPDDPHIWSKDVAHYLEAAV